MIKGTPCPECGEPYFGFPVCSKCGWEDEDFMGEWRKEQLEIAKDFEGFLTKVENK